MLDNLFSSLTFSLFLLWFLTYWIVGGILFATVAAAKFIRVNKAIFSCLFALCAILTAYAAAWMGPLAVRSTHLRCLLDSRSGGLSLQALFSCGPFEMIFSGVVWFFLLLGLGAAVMAVSVQRRDKRRSVAAVS